MKEVKEYNITMRGERTADVYSGENCDEHRPLWRLSCDGDRGETEDSADIILSPQTFPAGTKITVSIPVCPECHMDAELCETSECKFNWKDWADIQYS